MKRFLIIPILLFVCQVNLQAQSIQVQSLVNQGIELYKKGEYKESIDQYIKALAIDPTSDLANYEIASSYFALLDYEKAIKYCDAVIKARAFHVDEAFILKGSSLQILGKMNECIKMYHHAIKTYPQNYILYYHEANTFYKMQEYNEAEKAAIHALEIKPEHAGSNLLLGFIMNDQHKRVQSALALFNFLLIEPWTERSRNAYELLSTQLKSNVEKKGDNSITIYMNAPKGKDDFSSAAFMLSILEASNNLEENKSKTEAELFVSNTESFFAMMGELKKKQDNFWWNYYVDFFDVMREKKHVEAFCYYIQQCRMNEDIDAWVSSHKKAIDNMLNWAENYDRKH